MYLFEILSAKAFCKSQLLFIIFGSIFSRFLGCPIHASLPSALITNVLGMPSLFAPVQYIQSLSMKLLFSAATVKSISLPMLSTNFFTLHKGVFMVSKCSYTSISIKVALFLYWRAKAERWGIAAMHGLHSSTTYTFFKSIYRRSFQPFSHMQRRRSIADV